MKLLANPESENCQNEVVKKIEIDSVQRNILEGIQSFYSRQKEKRIQTQLGCFFMDGGKDRFRLHRAASKVAKAEPKVVRETAIGNREMDLCQLETGNRKPETVKSALPYLCLP